MLNPAQARARAVIDRLIAATNAHDLDALVACFAAEYELEAPLHPARGFRGTEQVRRNWTQIFAGVPDIVTRVVGTSFGDGDDRAIWTEWEMTGTRRDGVRHEMRGVFIFEVDTTAGAIRRGRMFFEPVDTNDATMDAVVRAQVGPA